MTLRSRLKHVRDLKDWTVLVENGAGTTYNISLYNLFQTMIDFEWELKSRNGASNPTPKTDIVDD